MELFKSKESCKEKFDSNNNWKTAWPRMILDWHLFLMLLLKYLKNKIPNFTSHKRKKNKEGEREKERERGKNIIQLQKHF